MKTTHRAWIAERLKFLRKKFGLQPKDVASKIHIPTKTYSAHEEKRSSPDPFRLKDICDIYGITLDEFFEPWNKQSKKTAC